MSTFFSLKSRPHSGSVSTSKKSKQEVTEVVSFSLATMVQKSMKVIQFNGGIVCLGRNSLGVCLAGKPGRGSSTETHTETTTYQRLCNVMTS